ncbi:MAG: RNase adapter RapZ [Burkholderiales bacterium]|nr:RNase adapter RapZ [Burkholderiales bacterium]
MELVLISGLSGSGKSIALAVLEDSGFYVVDNLPAKLLVDLVNHLEAERHKKVAISIDVRGGHGIEEVPRIREGLRNRDIDIKVLFLDAKTDTLVKRFSETRRRHPLSDGRRTLPECIEREREILEPVISIGHHIDTSDLSANALRQWVKEFVNADPHAGLTLMFQSFGFKHGIPLDADFVFDVRCLPNPHYDTMLRPLTGRDAPVVAFLEAEPAVTHMLGDIRDFVERWLPCFVRDNRSYLTVAIGCTGGRHRSVYFVETLARHFRGEHRVLRRHRELFDAE